MTGKKGLTLTELLVASALIGIVMIGVASFSASIEKMHNSSNRSTLVAMKAASTMNRLTRDAYLTVGDETDRGVITGGAGKKESICFRHDTDLDPSSYTGDTWTCYFINPQKYVFLCNPNLTPPVDNWGDCKTGAGDPQELLLSDVADFFTVVDDVGVGPLQYIEFNLEAKLIRNQPVHPVKNPVHTISSRVSPPGHSASR